MGNYDEFYEARAVVLDILRRDLLGPVETDETIDEPPLSYYATGKLYPSGLRGGGVDGREDIVDNKADDYDPSVSLDCQRLPSSLGITVSPGHAPSLRVRVDYATYSPERRNLMNAKTGRKYERTFWTRRQHSRETKWSIDDARTRIELPEGAELRIVPRPTIGEQGDVVTITLLNANDGGDDHEAFNARSIFQPSIRVELDGGYHFAPVERDASNVTDPDVLEMDMLYGHARCYGHGHGCSAMWDVDGGAPQAVESSFLPTYNLLQMRPAQAAGRRLFNMKHLAEASLSDVACEGRTYVQEYGRWIDALEAGARTLPERLHESARRNIDACRKAQRRIAEGIDLLESDELALRAFRLANRAMYEQRKASLRRHGVVAVDDDINW